MRMVLKIVIKCSLAAFSVTLMLLALVYTGQARDAREAAPRFIGQGAPDVSYLQDYTSTRQEMVFGFLREHFPQLKLPEAPAEPVPPSSLKALETRTRRD